MSEWPKRIQYGLHSSKDYNREIGEDELELKGEAIDAFAYCCYEVILELDVYENGSYDIIRIVSG